MIDINNIGHRDSHLSITQIIGIHSDKIMQHRNPANISGLYDALFFRYFSIPIFLTKSLKHFKVNMHFCPYTIDIFFDTGGWLMGWNNCFPGTSGCLSQESFLKSWRLPHSIITFFLKIPRSIISSSYHDITISAKSP